MQFEASYTDNIKTTTSQDGLAYSALLCCAPASPEDSLILKMPLLSKLVPDGFVPPDHLSQDAYLWLGGVLVVSPLVYYGLMAVYNIYFHPLSKYPGPKSWVATPFYYSMLQLRGTAPIETAKLHNKYGPIVRISAEELSVTYPGAWKDIYGHRKAGEAELSKDKRFFAGFKEPNLINSDREYHGYLRKLLSNGFSDSALRQQEGLVQQYLNTLMSRLHEKGGEGTVAVDLAHWYSVSCDPGLYRLRLNSCCMANSLLNSDSTSLLTSLAT